MPSESAIQPSLPVEEILADLRVRLRERDEVVLVAPPGAGKTTRVPLALLSETWLQGGKGKILLLEPRRLAARGAAERMAETLGEAVGQTVGYRVRLESRVSDATRIEVITEGILTRMLQDDPALEQVGLLIFDEFHERSLDADLGLALALQGRELFGDLRPQPLKLLLMSATLESDRLADMLANQERQPAPVVISEGRMHPVDVRYGSPWRTSDWIVPRVVETVLLALADQPGSLLVFLPGQGEIRAVRERLEARLEGSDRTLITPLYGDLDLRQQRQAIAPAPPGMRKITLTTSIAETSLTIEGVCVVVDSGLSRLPEFDPSTGMSRLHTRRLSRAAATQRCGRAGRLQPGVCYRLWSEDQQQQLRPFTPAEILQADLAPLALQLLRWGIDDPAELHWLDPPPQAPYQQALDLLRRLGAVAAAPGVANQWRLSSRGDAMAQLPAHPRLAHMMLSGAALGYLKTACQLAALLGEKDLLSDGSVDLQLRLDLLHGRHGDRQAPLSRLRRQTQLFVRLVQDVVNTAAIGQVSESQALGALLALAYPDRIAQGRGNGTWQMSNGRSVQFRDTDSLQKSHWLVIARISSRRDQATDRIDLAATFDPCLFDHALSDLIDCRDVVQWDDPGERFIAEKQRRVGSLVVSRTPLRDVPSSARIECLLTLVRKRGLHLLPWNDELKQWRHRVQLLRHFYKPSNSEVHNPWPDVSDTGLLESLDTWLAPYLDRVFKLGDFQRLDLHAALNTLLPWPLPQQLQELAPERYQVPSGSRIAIDYSVSPPVLAVRLQEMFGCRDTPTIARGQIPLLVHLLSPARRPIQVTQDLAGFWNNSYIEVQKDMKGRYPKHQWPDNPLQATPTARTTKPKAR